MKKNIFPKQRKKYTSKCQIIYLALSAHIRIQELCTTQATISTSHSLLQLSVRFDLWFRPKISQPIHSILRRAASSGKEMIMYLQGLTLCAVGGGKCQHNKLLLFKPISSKQASGKLDKNTQMTLVF